MKRIAALLLGAHSLLVWALPVALEAQQNVGQPIVEIQFVGLETLTPETLQFYLELEEGKPYRPAALNRVIHKLWDRELIDDISIDAQSAPGGVRLVVTIKERPTLRSIDYHGLKKIDRTDISDRIAKDRIRVREGDPLSLGELYRLKAAIEELYAEKGFRLAEANFSIEQISSTDRRVDFTVDEGDKVRVEDIDFEGNTVFRDARLRWVMKGTKESGMISRIRKKDVFNQGKFEEDLDKVRELYRKAGYKNVVMGDPQIEIRPVKPGAESEKEKKRRMFVTVPIEEGGRWKLGEITIEGNKTFSDQLLLRQFDKPQGGWLRSKVIGEGVDTIKELYDNTGHLFSQIDPELIERPEQIADLVIHIEEGDQFRIGRIEFQGNTRTRDKVIRREMGIQESLVLNTGALRNSLLRIGQMEFFKIDEEDPVEFDFNREDKTVDLSIKGEEGERTELLFGGGFSEIDGLFGQIQFRTRNFLGRGETIAVSVQSGSRQDIFDVSYHVPWFLDKPQSAGIQAFKRRLDYSLLSGQRVFQDTSGAVLTYGRNLGLFRSLNFSYSFFDTVDRRSTFTIDGDLVDQELSRTIAMLRVGFSKDRRNSRLQPTVGTRYTASIDYAGGVLGGTTSFYRPQASYTKYIPITKTGLRTSFAFNTKVGLIEPFDDSPLNFNDRFYLGGENSVRGFRFRTIWARDDEGNSITDPFGFPLGGERSFQMNFEYIFVMGGPFRIIIFSDAGQVFLGDQSLNLDTMSMSAGMELQVNVPILGAPLRFIYSTNINPLPDDSFESFQFSIGPSF